MLWISKLGLNNRGKSCALISQRLSKVSFLKLNYIDVLGISSVNHTFDKFLSRLREYLIRISLYKFFLKIFEERYGFF